MHYVKKASQKGIFFQIFFSFRGESDERNVNILLNYIGIKSTMTQVEFPCVYHCLNIVKTSLVFLVVLSCNMLTVRNIDLFDLLCHCENDKTIKARYF